MMGGYFFGGWMIIVWIVILGLIVWGVIALVRYASRNSASGSMERRSPLDIAKERYARGEITKEEFERIKKDLM
jgi:putative membrane protein